MVRETSTKAKEDKIIELWKKVRIYDKAKNLRKKAKKFYFLDGPPYATGSIHMGTAFNKILKDFYIRFFRVFGFNIWDQPGYDTHGVPIENKIEEKLNFKTKHDIEKFGVEAFINECRKFATQFIDLMGKQFSDLGVWMDWKHPYLTLTNDYIEGAWYTFKKAFEKGFLYKGIYPVHVCSHCETAVAYNEIIYENIEDISIYVKFKLKDKNEFLVIWTTTPWTLPANTGVMVKPGADYAKVKINDETLIIAEELLENLMKALGIENYQVLEKIKGKKLEGLKYDHPLADLFLFQQKIKNAHRVVLSDQFVTLEEGTGLVHCAPGHGQEDFKVGQEANLPAISPVKMNGTFNEECGKFSGVFVKDADKKILEILKEGGLLLKEEKITHEYPHCWRCGTPLLLISIPQWFFKVTAIRERLIEENKKINWVPAWAGQRFQNWLESLGDWPISRQRYWGIPLPIWVCEKCENVKVIGSSEELPEKLKDLHKPYIDKIILNCEKCKGKMKRVPDILDVWFDSGVAPWASLGYSRNKKIFEELWPVKFVLEGPDQIRGWWNSLLITSMLTFERSSFENVLFHGFVLDAHGIKMSKSLGNVVMPEEVVNKYGRDMLRFYFSLGPCWDDYHFKWEDVEEVVKFFVVVRNVFKFIKTYVPEIGKPKNFKKEDLWLLSKLNSLISSCTKHFNSFNAHKAAKEILDFTLKDFSRWYVKIIRDRVWPTYEGKDKEAAFFTLFTTTENLIKLLAPFCPFLAEEIYQEVVLPLRKGPESIHLCDWPKPNKKLIDKKLEEEMALVKQIVEACSAARQKVNLKLRWPVREVIVVSKDEKVNSAKNLEEILLFMCNTKSVKIFKEKPEGEFSETGFDFGSVFVYKKLDEKLLKEALIRELIRKIQELRKKFSFVVKEKILLTLNSDEKTNKVLEKNSEKLEKEVGAEKVFVGKLEGKFEGRLDFEKRTVEIKFART